MTNSINNNVPMLVCVYIYIYDKRKLKSLVSKTKLILKGISRITFSLAAWT